MTTLTHHYEVDEKGMITRCNLIVSTTHNNDAMNTAVKWVANNVISRKGHITEGMLNQVEVAIRAYDPCLSCATQAMGKMPLKAELYNDKGELLMKNSKTEKGNILLVGIGNSGRRDDGLGWKFTGLVNHSGLKMFYCEFRYQLRSRMYYWFAGTTK